MKKKYFLIMWENPSAYFFMNYLIKKISKKFNLYIFFLDNKFESNLNTHFEKTLRNCKIFKFHKKKKISNKLLYFKFAYKILKLVLIEKPNYIYMINRYSIFPLLLFNFFSNSKKIYHSLDFNNGKNIYFKILNVLEKICIYFCDILIVSHPKRKQYFPNYSNLKKIVFYNSIDKIKNNKSSKVYLDKKKIAYYFGSLGPSHGLKNLVKAFKLNNDFYLVIHGWIVDKSYFKELKKIARKSKNIIIKTNVKNQIWINQLSKSSLGIALYKNNSYSHKYMSGASQKMNIYLAAGLPILTSNSKDFKQFEKKYRCSKSANIDSIDDISRVIKKILNTKIYEKNAIKAFNTEFNFETQFKKIEGNIS